MRNSIIRDFKAEKIGEKLPKHAKKESGVAGGNLFTFDLFNKDEKNKHVVICGDGGSGKTTFAKELIAHETEQYSNLTTIVVTKHAAEYTKRQFINEKAKVYKISDFVINPFDIFRKVDKSELPYFEWDYSRIDKFISILKSMAEERNVNWNSNHYNLISRYIVDTVSNVTEVPTMEHLHSIVFSEFLGQSKKLTTFFVEISKSLYSEDVYHQKHKHDSYAQTMNNVNNLKDLLLILDDFVQEGSFLKACMNNETAIPSLNEQSIIIIDISEVKGNHNILGVFNLLGLLTEHLNCYSKNNNEKMAMYHDIESIPNMYGYTGLVEGVLDRSSNGNFSLRVIYPRYSNKELPVPYKFGTIILFNSTYEIQNRLNLTSEECMVLRFLEIGQYYLKDDELVLESIIEY